MEMRRNLRAGLEVSWLFRSALRLYLLDVQTFSSSLARSRPAAPAGHRRDFHRRPDVLSLKDPCVGFPKKGLLRTLVLPALPALNEGSGG